MRDYFSRLYSLISRRFNFSVFIRMGLNRIQLIGSLVVSFDIIILETNLYLPFLFLLELAGFLVGSCV